MFFPVFSIFSIQLAACLIIGILLGRLPYGYPITIPILILCYICVYKLLKTIKQAGKVRQAIPPMFMIIGFALITFQDAQLSTKQLPPNVFGQKNMTITGTVDGDFKYYKHGNRFVLKLESYQKENGKVLPLQGKVMLSAYSRKGQPLQQAPLPADRVTITHIKLRPITTLQNFGGFNYIKYLQAKGISARAYLPSAAKITVINSSRLSPHRLGEKWRRELHRFISTAMPADISAVAAAMTIGITEQISSDLRSKYNSSGIGHLLAISGLHVGFIATITLFGFYLLLFFTIGKAKPATAYSGNLLKIAALLSLFAIMLFLLISGMRVSAIRAGVMAATMLIAILLERQKQLSASLAIAALIILLHNPAALFSAGFLMSFLAVASIILLLLRQDETEGEQDPLPIKARLKKWLTSTLKISLAVTFAIAPVTLSFFGQLHLGGILANVIALPIAAVAIPLALIGSIIGSFLPTIGGFMLAFATPLFDALNHIATLFSQTRLLSFTGSPMPAPLVAIYYTALLAILFRHKLRLPATTTAAVFMLLYYMPPARGFSEVRFIDVGQGDSTLIMLRSGENILIDSGLKNSRIDMANIAVLPTLYREKIKKIDILISTHGDADHAGGIETILTRIKVGKYFENGQKNNRKQLEKAAAAAKAAGVPVKTLQLGDSFSGKGWRLSVIHPSKQFLQKNIEGADNEIAIALLLEVDGIKILLPADVERLAEAEMLKNNVVPDVDILKIAHHGSNSSSSAAFLKTAKPELAIISAGKLNRWHFPSKKVTSRLDELGIAQLSTLALGQIAIKIKDGKWQSRSFASPAWHSGNIIK